MMFTDTKKSSIDTVDILNQCRRRLAVLKTQRSTWDSHWRELRDNIFPWAGNWLDVDSHNDGKKRSDPIVSTGREALLTLASGMQGGLTPRSERWFGLKIAQHNNTQADQRGSFWLDQCTSLILDILAESNFYHVSAQMYEDLGLFGTSCMYIEPDFNTVVTFRHIDVGEFYISDNWKGKTDTLFREFKMSARSVVDEFGEKSVSDNVRSLAESNPDKEITIIHAVFPRRGGDKNAINPLQMPYASVYYEASATNGQLLRHSGYRVFPFLVARWQVHGEDSYGHSPAMYALADVLQAKEMMIDVMTMVANTACPPMQGPDTLDNADIKLEPNSITLIPQFQSGARLETIYQHNPDAMQAYQVVQEVLTNIRKAFFYDVFVMFDGTESKSMTATEVLERKQVRLTQLGPVLERLQTEIFGPMIDIIFDRCVEVGILPQVPDSIPPATQIDVRYKSALARAADYSRVTNIQQFLSLVAQTSQANPSMLENIDFDSLVRTLGDYLDVPPQILRSEKDLQAMRQQQAEQQAQMQQLQMLQQSSQTADTVADAAKNMGSVDMDKNTAYTQLMNALAGGVGSGQ